MEHLPLIVDPAYPLPKIPCYCKSDDYDRQGMANFPQRAGWKIDRQDGPVRFNETTSRIASPVALLQAWLFFGFLQDVFSIGQTEIDIHAFQQQMVVNLSSQQQHCQTALRNLREPRGNLNRKPVSNVRSRFLDASEAWSNF